MHRPLALGAPGLALALILTLVPAAPSRAQSPTPPPSTAPRGGSASGSAPATSPAPGAPLRLNLADATALALRQQPTIRSAQQSKVAADAKVPQAQSFYYPRLDAQIFFGRSEAFSNSQNRTLRSDSTTAVLSGRQLIYDFGKTAAVVDEAKANSRVAGGELDRVRELVVQNVRTAYFGLLQAQRLVGVADANLARSELNLRSAQGFFDVGTKPKSDVTRAEVDVANARVLVIRARNNVRIAQTTLANALGLEATLPLDIEDNLAYQPVSLDPAQLLTEALTNRPELRQAQARLDASRAQLAGARARYAPDLNLTGSVGGASGDLAFEGLADLSQTWALGVTLTWNLFEGFFTQNRVKETEALVETARANAEAFELQVRLEVEQSYITVIEASERIGATEKAIESARENLRLQQGRYDAGVGTILDLTDAQLALSNAEADNVRALTDYRVGLAALDRAVGRL